MALAGKLEKNIYVINLASSMMTDEILGDLMSNAEEGCILLLEDVDGALSRVADTPVNNNNKLKEEQSRKLPGELKIVPPSNLTYSGILNAFDGVGSQEGRILFMTSNNIEKLPTALIRGGRIDKRICISYADKYQIEQLFLKFFPDKKELSSNFADKLSENIYTMSELQSYLMNYKNSCEDAISNLHLLEKKDN